MSIVPSSNRAEEFANPDSVILIRKWLWHHAASGWDPSVGVDERWSHEDNMEATKLGWLIAAVPETEFIDLFSIDVNRTAAEQMATIASMALIDPLCAKALAILNGARFKHPKRKYNFLGEV